MMGGVLAIGLFTPALAIHIQCFYLSIQSPYPFLTFPVLHSCHRMTPQVYMNNVTLVVAQSDYLALLAAALRGVNWEVGAYTTKP